MAVASERYLEDLAVSPDQAAVLFSGPRESPGEGAKLVLLNGSTVRGQGFFGGLRKSDINGRAPFIGMPQFSTLHSGSDHFTDLGQVTLHRDRWLVFGVAKSINFAGGVQGLSILAQWTYDRTGHLLGGVVMESPLSSDPAALVSTGDEVVFVSSYAPTGVIFASRTLRLRRISRDGDMLDEWELPDRSTDVSLAADGDAIYLASGIVNPEYEYLTSEIMASGQITQNLQRRSDAPAHTGYVVERLVWGQEPEPVIHSEERIIDLAAHGGRLLVAVVPPQPVSTGDEFEPVSGRLSVFTSEGRLLKERRIEALIESSETRKTFSL